MPQTFAAWATGYASFGAAAAAGAGAAAAYAAAYVVATLAITVGLSKASAALMGRPRASGAAADRRAVQRASTMGRTILYGEGVTAGVLIYCNTSGAGSAGDNNKYMDLAIAVAGHEIDELTDCWFDDVKIPYEDINNGNPAGGMVTDGAYANYAEIYKFLGTDDQAASDVLVDQYSRILGFPLGEWDATHRLRGCAYIHVRLWRSADVFPYGAPQNIRIGFRGARVYDPRYDSTNGGVGSQRIADPSTWTHSRNPALIAADYLIGGTITNTTTRTNLRGFGADPDDVDWPSIIAAANVCDETVTVPDGTQVRYQADGGLTTDNKPADNIEQILTSMLGQMTYSAGKYCLYAGVYQTPTLTLDEGDLAGAVEYVTGTSRSERYNAVKGVRWDSATGEEVEFYPRTSTEYETDDGSTLYRDIELPFTTDEYRAQRIAQIILRRSREQQMIIWNGNLGCLRVGVWDTVAVSLAELGISNKTFRCISRDVQMQGGEQIVSLTLREEFSQTYTDPIVADYGDLTPANPLPVSGDSLAPPTDLIVRSTAGGIEFVIIPATDNPPGVEFELYRHTSASPWASSELIWTGSATTVTLSFDENSAMYFWVRARRGAAVSDPYPDGDGVIEVYIPAAPSNLVATLISDGVQLSWTLPAEMLPGDIVEVLQHTASTPASSATVIWSGLASSALIHRPDESTYYYWVRIKAANGRYSSTEPYTFGLAIIGTSTGELVATPSTVTVSVSGTTSSVSTASVTVTASGGTPSYTYAWAKLSGDTISADSASAATTTFTATGLAADETRTATFRCTVTDGDSPLNTSTCDVLVSINRATMIATASPSSVSGTGSSIFGIQITSNSTTVSVTGGTPPYSYAWTKVSGDNITPVNALAATTTFKATVYAASPKTATYKCTVADSAAASVATNDVSIVLTNIGV